MMGLGGSRVKNHQYIFLIFYRTFIPNKFSIGGKLAGEREIIDYV